MRRSPLGIAIVVAALIAFAWWRSAERAPHAPPPAAVPAEPAAAPAPPPMTRVAPQDGYDLSRDERLGGHTLARHVGRTDAQLIERLRLEPNISAASTYTDRAAAEATVARALRASASRVDGWLSRHGARPNLAVDYHGQMSEPIGRSIRRGSRTPVTCVDAVVVLRWDRGRTFYVLTSYPEAAR